MQAIATGVTQNYGNSIECFEKAIALDPEFALAYVGIARVTAFKSLYGRVPPLEGHVKIKEALGKAFELDGDLAEAYAVNGYTIFLFDKDFSLGEENFNTALRLNPNNAFILILYANCLSAARRHDEAIQAGEKAKMLDPLSFYISGQICLYYFRQGTFDKAEQVIKQGLDLQPTYFVYHLLLGLSQLGASKFTEALDSFALAKTYSGGTPMAFYGLGATYQALGDDANMNNAFDAVFQAEAANYVPEVVLAMVYSRKKDTQKGLKYLKKSYENKDLLLLFMIGNQTAFSVTNEPEYCEYLKEVGLWK